MPVRNNHFPGEVILHRALPMSALIIGRLTSKFIYIAKKIGFCLFIEHLSVMNSFQIRDKHQRKRRITILHEDDDLLIVDKPAGIPVIRDRWDANLPNLKELLQKQYGKKPADSEQAVWVVHRIDMDTSGIVMLARHEEAHRRLNRLFQERLVEKTYLAVTSGIPQPDRGEISAPMEEHPSRKRRMRIARKGKAAVTRYETLETFRRFALLQLSPISGRTHQIRLHLQHIGAPLAVDPMYGSHAALDISMLKRSVSPRRDDAPISPLINRLTLHASRLRFKHPFSETQVDIEAPLPKDFSALLKRLRKYDRID